MSEPTTMDMKAARRALSFFSKMPVWLYEFALKQTRMAEPPKRLALMHNVEKGSVDGVNYVWINKDKSKNGVLVHAHGGGYTAGPFEAMWDWLCALTDATETAGVLVDYRKAGAAPYPAAPDDLERVIKHLQESQDLKPGKWAMIGDSAGGGLALILTTRQLNNQFPPACVIALSPFVNMALDHPETPEYEPLDISISRKLLNRGIRTYAAGHNVADPELSPINADVSGFPPVNLCVGTNEMFLPDIRAYKKKLEAANIELEYHEEPGAIHVYPMIVNSDESRRAVASHTAFLSKHLGLHGS